MIICMVEASALIRFEAMNIRSKIVTHFLTILQIFLFLLKIVPGVSGVSGDRFLFRFNDVLTQQFFISKMSLCFCFFVG